MFTEHGIFLNPEEASLSCGNAAVAPLSGEAVVVRARRGGG